MTDSHHRDMLKPSEYKWTVIALYLLHLLAENRVAEYHTLLEQLDLNQSDKNLDISIRAAIDIERRLSEGSYRYVLQLVTPSSDPKHPSMRDSIVQILPPVSYFMERIASTVRFVCTIHFPFLIRVCAVNASQNALNHRIDRCLSQMLAHYSIALSRSSMTSAPSDSGKSSVTTSNSNLAIVHQMPMSSALDRLSHRPLDMQLKPKRFFEFAIGSIKLNNSNFAR